MKHSLLLTGLVLAATAGIAAATSLGGVSSTRVSAGNTAVARCDSDGFTVAYTTSGGNVTAVTVGGIADPGCEGATLRVTVTDGDGAGIASGGPQTIPTDSDSMDNAVAVSLSPQPAAELPAGVEISIVGP